MAAGTFLPVPSLEHSFFKKLNFKESGAALQNSSLPAAPLILVNGEWSMVNGEWLAHFDLSHYWGVSNFGRH
jgi:hypothetical protein